MAIDSPTKSDPPPKERTPSLSPTPTSPSTPREPTKAELANARRRARAAEKREERRQAALDRFLYGAPIEEVVTFEEDEDLDAPLYCSCQRPDDGREMICCEEGDECEIGWFHLDCVGQEVLELDEWTCDDCKNRINIEKFRNRPVFSQADIDMIVPPTAKVLRAPAGDVYGLISWKKEWLQENVGDQQDADEDGDEEDEFWAEDEEPKGWEEEAKDSAIEK